jgi:actin cytoskeleton-regulatory complex protein PAN1
VYYCYLWNSLLNAFLFIPAFGENLIIIANPSKSGGDWWYGTISSTNKSGFFPNTYVEVVQPSMSAYHRCLPESDPLLGKVKAIYGYASDNSDELTFTEGDILSIVDMSEEEWWKAEQGGVVFIVPAAYLEVVEG